MKSMTGYGRAVRALEGFTITAQVSSVNRKSLDLTIALPDEWESLEPRMGELARKFANRGKVHIDIEVTGDRSGEAGGWDDEIVSETLVQLRTLAAREGIEFRPTPELLWQIVNAQRRTPGLPMPEAAQATVMEALTGALREFAAMRAKEGEALLVDCIQRGEALHRLVGMIATRAPQVPANYREQLLKRLREAGLELDLNDERVLREIALFADRCDISEEITRLRSHLEQFSMLMKSDGEIGRKSEFLLQEMGRETNTIGSKANDLAIVRAVMELKNELERLREQLANVE